MADSGGEEDEKEAKRAGRFGWRRVEVGEEKDGASSSKRTRRMRRRGCGGYLSCSIAWIPKV